MKTFNDLEIGDKLFFVEYREKLFNVYEITKVDKIISSNIRLEICIILGPSHTWEDSKFIISGLECCDSYSRRLGGIIFVDEQDAINFMQSPDENI